MALTLTATANMATVPPSVTITLDGATSPTVLIRQSADGSQATVRTAGGLPIPTATTNIVDYAAPFGQQLTYIAGAVSSNPVVVAVTEPWLIHPGRPSLSMPVTIAEFGSRATDPAQGVFRVIGRRNPIVVSDGQAGPLTSSVTVQTKTLVELTRLGQLLADASPLFLNVPATLGWGVTSEYISITSTDEARLIDYAGLPNRYVTLPYIVVDPPVAAAVGGGSDDGGLSGTRTWADLALEAGTWAEASGLYTTWADAATGNRA